MAKYGSEFDPMKKIPTSPWARGAKLLMLATEVAAKEVGSRIQGKASEAADKLMLRVEQTQLLVNTLSQMKGAAMKAGQLSL
jgi:predicted unusual protein kinase regulating ubiquinone biosynthesis (AarF/ABC1/UbiB family)